MTSLCGFSIVLSKISDCFTKTKKKKKKKKKHKNKKKKQKQKTKKLKNQKQNKTKQNSWVTDAPQTPPPPKKKSLAWFCFYAIDGTRLKAMPMKGIITFILNSNHKIQVNLLGYLYGT